ncbi:MAG: hypothetical protein IJ197_00570 [Bacteroidaceae bacterium]|nr:hypothetical protein [Bacteroidaceae bacterium]
MKTQVGFMVVWLLVSIGSVQAQALFTFDDEGMARTHLELSAHGRDITGLCLMRQSEDTLRGSVINEFGIKAFDFTYREGKTKLMNVASFLNKWYIRRTLQRDLSFLFSQTTSCCRGQRSVEKNGDTVSLVNKRHKLTYRFRNLDEITE